MATSWVPFLLWSLRALADDSPTQKLQAAKTEANSPAPADPSLAQETSNQSPEQLGALAYQKAVASYADGDVIGALGSMRESYQLSKRAELLYNLAQLEEELKGCSDALSDYRRYLELVPNGRYRDSAEQARGRLERECAPPPPAEQPSAEPVRSEEAPKERAVEPAPQTSYWTASRIIGWSAISAGTLAGAGALYFQLQAVQARDEFKRSNDEANAGGPPVDLSLQDQQHRYNRSAIGLGITSGALIASGVLVLLLAPAESKRHSRSATLYAFPGVVGASYAQRF